jgi:hypothetical protein
MNKKAAYKFRIAKKWANDFTFCQNSASHLLLTVCITSAGAGVDSVWEQENLEARKMLENAAESTASSARFVRWRV